MLLLLQVADGPWETDELIADERYAAAAVKGKGVVVFSACSHAGVWTKLVLAVATLMLSCSTQACGSVVLDVQPLSSYQGLPCCACCAMLCRAGIINVMKDVQQRFGEPPYAVFGGKQLPLPRFLLTISFKTWDAGSG